MIEKNYQTREKALYSHVYAYKGWRPKPANTKQIHALPGTCRTCLADLLYLQPKLWTGNSSSRAEQKQMHAPVPCLPFLSTVGTCYEPFTAVAMRTRRYFKCLHTIQLHAGQRRQLSNMSSLLKMRWLPLYALYSTRESFWCDWRTIFAKIESAIDEDPVLTSALWKGLGLPTTWRA